MKIKKLNNTLKENYIEDESKSIKESNIKNIYYHNDIGGLNRGQWLNVKEKDGKLFGKWNFEGDGSWREITDVEEMPYHNFHGAKPSKTFTWGGWRYWLDDEVENFWDIEGERIRGDFEIPGMPHVKRNKVEESKSIKTFGAKDKKVNEAIDGWDNRTGIIKRIDKYLSDNSEAIPPKGYIKRGTRAYDYAASMYGDYVTTSYGNITTDNLMSYAREHKLLEEANYGGAYDIADDQYFTRDDINSAAEEVLNHINETFYDKYVVGGTWLEGDNWIVNIQPEDGRLEFENSIKIDMRRIRNPLDLKRKYASELAAKIISDIKEYQAEESNDLLESATDFMVGDEVYVKVSNRRGIITKVFDDIVEVEMPSNGIYPTRIDRFYKEDVELLSIDDEDNENYSWKEVASKQVYDSDGFLTDYTWYTDGDNHIFIFGDKDVYTPEDSYTDWECDDEESAKEWFDNYHGFEEDDEDTFQDELNESIVYRAEYHEPKIDKWISIGERTSKEEANKLLDTPIMGNPKMRVQKYEKSGARKVKYKELNEDTVRQNGKWVNKGKEGTHGKFNTKKAADAQRKAMFANGYKEGLCEGVSEYINLGYFDKVKYSATEYDDGTVYITSHHPYDDSEYHWAISKDGGNKFTIYINSPGQKVEVFKSNPDAEYNDVVERLSELDKDIKPRMMYEDWLDDLDDSELDADIENAKLTTQPEQEFSSADTSQNQLASVFKQVDKRGEFVPETINLDYGGGRYDQGTDFMSKRGIKNLVYDAFNRNAAHNRRVENYINRNGGADTSTCANVLNVIKEPAIRHSVIQNIYDLLKPNGTAYFTTYEGNKSGKGDTSIKKQGIATSYQNHRDTKTYIEEIEDVFGKGNVSIKNKVITAVKR